MSAQPAPRRGRPPLTLDWQGPAQRRPRPVVVAAEPATLAATLDLLRASLLSQSRTVDHIERALAQIAACLRRGLAPPQEPEWLSTAEAAKRIRRSAGAIRRLVERGELEAQRDAAGALLRPIRVRRAAVDSLVEAHDA